MKFIPIAEPSITDKEINYVKDAVASTWVSSKGEFMERFIKAQQDFFNTPYVLPVNNGTAALFLPLLSLDLKPDDEVIVPALTFAATINTVLLAGAKPVVVDVDERGQLDASKVAEAITPKTKVIIPVHLYGEAADMVAISDLAKQHNLVVIEDVAEAFGSVYQGKLLGTWGDFGSFSFFGNKIITTGEGGLIVVKDEARYEKLKLIMNHGMTEENRYWHTEVGCNMRLTNMQAALGVAQLERYEEITKKKEEIFSYYFDNIKNPLIKFFNSKAGGDDNKPARWFFNILLPDTATRDKLITVLQKHDIDFRRCFYSLPEMEIYQPYCVADDYPQAKKFSETLLSIPSGYSLTAEQLEHIVKVLSDFKI